MNESEEYLDHCQDRADEENEERLAQARLDYQAQIEARDDYEVLAVQWIEDVLDRTIRDEEAAECSPRLYPRANILSSDAVARLIVAVARGHETIIGSDETCADYARAVLAHLGSLDAEDEAPRPREITFRDIVDRDDDAETDRQIDAMEWAETAP